VILTPRLSDINDKSKSDAFARTVSVAQITWIAVQVFIRVVRRLAVSQLEIAVVAFSACAIFIYVLDWKKPKSVLVPHSVLLFPGAIPRDVIRTEDESWCNAPNLTFIFGLDAPFYPCGCPIPNDVVARNYTKVTHGEQFFSGLTLGSYIFGGIHIAAWNFSFPTAIEQILWRISSLYCTSFIIWFIFVFLVFSEDFDWARRIVVAFLSSLYVLCRLFMIVEMFRTLCFLPPDAYTPTRATNIPHLA
jgi:hypothetical protein